MCVCVCVGGKSVTRCMCVGQNALRLGVQDAYMQYQAYAVCVVTFFKLLKVLHTLRLLLLFFGYLVVVVGFFFLYIFHIYTYITIVIVVVVVVVGGCCSSCSCCCSCWLRRYQLICCCSCREAGSAEKKTSKQITFCTFFYFAT